LQTVLVFPSISAISLQEYIADRRLHSAGELTVDGFCEASACEASTSVNGVSEASACKGSASVNGVSQASASVSSDRRCMTFVFIDCTWYQVHRIATDPRVSSKFIVCFWLHCQAVYRCYQNFASVWVFAFLPTCLDLSGSRDVIGHVTILSTLGGFI